MGPSRAVTIRAERMLSAVTQTITWGTVAEANRLGCRVIATRPWAHAWIRSHMERLPLQDTVVVDAGSGSSNPLLEWYRRRVRRAYLIDLAAERGQDDTCTILGADLERGLPLSDASVDLVSSASRIEHLSESGQIGFLCEAARVLRPGGLVVMSVSYVFGLDERALEVISRDPAFRDTGCTLSARVDLHAMLEAAPRLRPPVTPRWDRFPGFDGFSEASILGDPGVILDRVGSYGTVRCRPETDALALKWAEIGLYLRKR